MLRTSPLLRPRRRHRMVLAMVAGGCLALGPLTIPAQAQPLPFAGGAPSIVTSGTLVRLVVEDHDVAGGPHAAGHDAEEKNFVRTEKGALVPVTGASVHAVRPGSTVRVRATVPTEVAGKVAGGSPVQLEGGAAVAVPPSTLTSPTDPAAGELASAVAAYASSTGQPLTVTDATTVSVASASYAPAVHRLYIAVARPAGSTAAFNSASAIQQQVTAASTYWSEQSGGGITLAVQVISAPYTSAYSCSQYNNVWNEAAGVVGFTGGANNHLVVSFPRDAMNQGCSYGLGSVGSGVNSGGVVYVSDTAVSGSATSFPVLAHELGHNFGLQHATRLICPAGQPDASASSCTRQEYGDGWDIMAMSAQNNAGALSTPQAHRLGILGDAAVRSLTASATVSLSPVASYGGVRAVAFTDPVTGERYYVEYRTRAGRDYLLYQDLAAGVRVLRVDSADQRSLALDATPTGSGGDLAWQVPVSSSFLTRSGAVRVLVSAADASTATVTVLFGGTVPAATLVDRCGTATDGYQVPSASGVEYLVSGVVTSAGTYTGLPVTVTARYVGTTAIVGTWTISAVDNSCTVTVGVGDPSRSATGQTVPLTWGLGAPPAASGPFTYEVSTRWVMASGAIVSYGPERTWYSGTTATGATFSGELGGAYQVRARALDAQGNRQAWSEWRLVTLPTDDAAWGIRWVGSWKDATNSASISGSQHVTSSRFATVWAANVLAPQVTVLGTKSPDGSQAAVYVDGVYHSTIDTYAATRTDRAVLVTLVVGPGQHTVALRNLATDGRPNLGVDAFLFTLKG